MFLSQWEKKSAYTKLPSYWKKDEKLKRVDDVIALLDLSRVEDTIVGDETHRGVIFVYYFVYYFVIILLLFCYYFVIILLLFCYYVGR